MDGSEPILLVSHDADDHGWQFIGTSDAAMDDAMLVSLESIVRRDPTVLEVADLPPGWQAVRSAVGEPWTRYENPAVEHEEEGDDDDENWSPGPHETQQVNPLRYHCTKCGEEHEGLPDMAFGSPIYFEQMPAQERKRRAVLTSDTCVIDGQDYFIRCCLPVPIKLTSVSFVWGVWVSLSEKNFKRYVELFKADPPKGEGPYFGWLSNQLPEYPDTLSLKACVQLQKNNKRPLVELEPTDHPLAIHQRDGIPLPELLDILGERTHQAN
jgi:hypothetical protein